MLKPRSPFESIASGYFAAAAAAASRSSAFEWAVGRRQFSLDTLVTVVDSTSFMDEIRRADDLEERGIEAEEGDTRTVADLLMAQVGLGRRNDREAWLQCRLHLWRLLPV